MNSGDRATPTIFSSRFLPLSSALKVEPICMRWALAKASLTVTSSVLARSGSRPSRRCGRLRRGSCRSGIETAMPEAGSASPSTSSSDRCVMRGSAAATPGMTAICSATDVGARRTWAKTSAKR